VTTTVYTDGACIGNPGPGGWAWAVPGGAFASGAEARSTNQRMELTAALSAVRAIIGPLQVISDSTYVVNCFTQRWHEGWQARGWKKVANTDLWQPLIELYHARAGELEFRWVKGHGGDPMNDVVDRLATEAANTQVGRRGDTPPNKLGPADQPRRPHPASGSQPPAGHLVAVFGHRPDQLGGYGDNPIAAHVRRKLTETLRGLRVIHPDLVVLTGLNLGTEQLAAQAAAEADVPYAAVLAYPNPDNVWPATSRAIYQQLFQGATTTITLSSKEPASKPEAGKALSRRNDWLVSHAHRALVVWDGRDTNLGAVVRALERRIPDDVQVISPES
jgi:ribonuclease HI/uncharacterized phage-like protein YoqJ